MKRKMLISIALITIMLLNCMMPIFTVHAAEGEGIQLNSTLFYAVVEAINCEENGNVSYTIDEGTHTIYISAEELAKVKCLDLAGKGINDLTNLDKFTSLEDLVLASNDLYSGSESNLSVLDNLTNLRHLNLSENHLESVADIPATMERLFEKEEGTILLTGQIVNKVVSVDMDTTTENATIPEHVVVEVPEILSLAGDLKSVWKTKEGYMELTSPLKIEEKFLKDFGLPYIDYAKFADLYKVGPNSKSLTVTVADSNGNPYYGMLRYTIKIVDEKGESGLASNLNKASENPLYESVFNIYVVVNDASDEAITMVDENLYYAIKEQLTGGQTVNKDLSSYPYVVDVNGETIYVEYIYTTTTIDGTDYQILTENGKETPSYYYDAKSMKVYEYDGEGVVGDLVTDVTLTPATIEIVDETNGTVTKRNGYTTPFKAEDTGDTLYIAAYDDAYTFVIDDLVLTNEITSLILDGKKIQYLDGIERFVGLTSELDLSYNYLDGIEELASLQQQKDNWEAQLVEAYLKWLRNNEKLNLNKSASELEATVEEVKNAAETNKDAGSTIVELLRKAAQLTGGDATDEQVKAEYDKALQEISNQITAEYNKIYGYTNNEGQHVDGLLDTLNNRIDGDKDNKGVQVLLMEVYSLLSRLYNIYNDEYKMTTFLADSVNYTVYTEYETYVTSLNAFESTEAMGKEQIAHVVGLEASGALSQLDMDLLLSVFPGIRAYMIDSETPVADYFAEQEYNHIGYKRLLKQFRIIGIYSELANYCLIKRMEEDTATGICYAEEYLEKRIAELDLENIPTDYEEAILARLAGEAADLDFLEDGFIEDDFEEATSAYTAYAALTYEYGETISLTSGQYYPVTDIKYTTTAYGEDEVQNLVLPEGTNGNYDQAMDALDNADAANKAIIKSFYLAEEVNGTFGPESQLVVYEQLITLAKKLLNGNVERYIQLPDLKKLNLAENGHLDDLAGLTELKSLVDLNADHCAFSDVESIDWSLLPNLRRLSLSHNGIQTMDPFVKLKNLTYLDLSKNNIKGKIDIDSNDFPTFFDDLEYLNLAENQIDDIRSIQLFLDGVTNGNYGEFLANTDEFVLDLQRQNITINIEKPIIYNPAVKNISVDLDETRLFTQLKAIDTKRTAFGMNSENGSIDSEGTYILIDVSKPGEFTAVANVENIDSNAAVEDYCIGYGSKITVNYKVVAGAVSDFTISPEENVTVNAGETVQFTGTVTGENLYDNGIAWSVSGNNSTGTKIDSKGLLTVAEDETSTALVVSAHPVAEERMVINVNVTVVPKPATENPENPGTENPENPGTQNPENPGTQDPEDGVVDPDDLGYEKGDTTVYAKAKTSIENFRTILLNGKQYNVVVTKELANGEKETITSGNIGTGMLVKVVDDEGNQVVDENGNPIAYEVVVEGDVNGDGLANGLDSVIIKAARNEVISLSVAHTDAADINDDGKINVTDSKLLLYHRAEVKGYDLNYAE